MEEKISELESENFRLSSKSYKLRESQTETDTPPESRKKRLLDYTDVQNTPSPLSTVSSNFYYFALAFKPNGFEIAERNAGESRSNQQFRIAVL